jgi:hypothetical protein
MSWQEPFDNYAPVTGYVIKFANIDQTVFTTELTNCDAGTIQIAEEKSCNIPLALFREVPFSLQFDQLVVGKVSACNTNGCGLYSELNT